MPLSWLDIWYALQDSGNVFILVFHNQPSRFALMPTQICSRAVVQQNAAAQRTWLAAVLIWSMYTRNAV